MKEINEHSTFPLVLDFSDKATLNDFHCFANNSYIAGIARIYKNVPYGEVDENAMENYANARKGKFWFEKVESVESQYFSKFSLTFLCRAGSIQLEISC